MQQKSLKEYIVSDHAAFEMKRRGISEDQVRTIIEQPEQRLPVREGREIFQSRIHTRDGLYLYRVVVDVDRSPAEVVTAYRTSKIEKYWRIQP
jgi:hypothetical protein